MAGKTVRYEIIHRCRHKDGGWRWILTRGDIIKNSQGKPVRWVGTNLDITEHENVKIALQRQNEDYEVVNEELRSTTEELQEQNDKLRITVDKIREGEEKFSNLFNESPYPVMIVDTDNGCFADVNEEIIKNVEYSREELIGKSAVELGIIVPETEFEMRKLIAENGQFSNFEVSIKTKSGKYLCGLATGRIIEINNHSYLIETIVDITERKRVEEALRDREEKYYKYIDNAPDGIFVADNNGRYIEVNNAACLITGYSKDELLGMSITDMLFKESLSAGFASFKEALETGSSKVELNFRHKDGSKRWWSVDSVKLSESYAIAFVKDITERIQIEKKIKSLLAEKELMLKEIHHRIKNNMNTVTSLLSLQAQTVEEPSAVSALQEARAKVQSMSILYDNLYRSVDFKELSVKEYINSLVDEVVANFPNSQNVKIEKDLVDFMLDAKRVQSLGIIINELLTNIMKYAFKGRKNGSIRVSAIKTDDHVTISVEDDGIGMPDSISLENSTGFGLQLVKALTQQLKGIIRIERENGTKVVLEFDL